MDDKIDPFLVEPLKNLWDAGYTTYFSCSGLVEDHPGSAGFYPYLCIDINDFTISDLTSLMSMIIDVKGGCQIWPIDIRVTTVHAGETPVICIESRILKSDSQKKTHWEIIFKTLLSLKI